MLTKEIDSLEDIEFEIINEARPKKKYHYVYRITNIIIRKHYYGVRSSNIDPKKDIGVKYFSSSLDDSFIKDQKANPENYKYVVVKVFNNREEAESFEQFMHVKFQVHLNENFYNRSIRIDGEVHYPSRYGMTHNKRTREKLSEINSGKQLSQETKDKISKSSIGKHISQETKEKIRFYRIGKSHNQETKEKISKSKKGFKHSQETKLKMRDHWQNNPQVYTRERNLKISLSKKGKVHSEETKLKIKQARANQRITDETKNKISDAFKKLKWIFNSKLEQNKRVPEEELDLYLSNGWELGRIIKRSSK